MKKKLKLIVPVVAVALIVGAIMLANNTKGAVTTISKSTLQKVLEISELSTVDYNYNATATQYDDENKPMYYVAYEGSVTAGIDFSAIEFDIDEQEKTVDINLPQIAIHNVKVDMGTMEYIFVNKKYETEVVSQQAYKLCLKDLKSRIEGESVLYDTAKANAISTVKALLEPWIETVDSEFQIKIS